MSQNLENSDRADQALPEDLAAVGARVAGLPHPLPPAGLAERTVARLTREGVGAVAAPLLRSWWRRRFTHPGARVAALLAVAVLATLYAATVRNYDRAERLGKSIERWVGSPTIDRVERVADPLLRACTPAQISDEEFERLVGSPGLPNRPRPENTPHRRRRSILQSPCVLTRQGTV